MLCLTSCISHYYPQKYLLFHVFILPFEEIQTMMEMMVMKSSVLWELTCGHPLKASKESQRVSLQEFRVN